MVKVIASRVAALHSFQGGWASLYPCGPLDGLPLRFWLLQGWGILTNFKVPVLADTLLSHSIQTTYK